jgi:hypothetical protein
VASGRFPVDAPPAKAIDQSGKSRWGCRAVVNNGHFTVPGIALLNHECHQRGGNRGWKKMPNESTGPLRRMEHRRYGCGPTIEMGEAVSALPVSYSIRGEWRKSNSIIDSREANTGCTTSTVIVLIPRCANALMNSFSSGRGDTETIVCTSPLPPLVPVLGSSGRLF